MKTVYIASPYTQGDVAVNVRNSIIAAEQLVTFGFIPFVPLLSHFWHMMCPHEYSFWTTLDDEWVLRCDCVLRLPGESKGADREVKLAKKKGIPVFYSINELIVGRNRG